MSSTTDGLLSSVAHHADVGPAAAFPGFLLLVIAQITIATGRCLTVRRRKDSAGGLS